jgi:hypothetical protein
VILNGEFDFFTPRSLHETSRLHIPDSALARQLTVALPLQMKAGWRTELNAQLYREAEIVSLLQRATSSVWDPELLFLILLWEAAWLPRRIEFDSGRMMQAQIPC